MSADRPAFYRYGRHDSLSSQTCFLLCSFSFHAFTSQVVSSSSQHWQKDCYWWGKCSSPFLNSLPLWFDMWKSVIKHFFLNFISCRLMNAELEAKTAELVRQAEQLMVSNLMSIFYFANTPIICPFGNKSERWQVIYGDIPPSKIGKYGWKFVLCMRVAKSQRRFLTQFRC